MTRRKLGGPRPVNRYVERKGRRYRVCFYGDRPGAHVLIVAVKLARGGERAIEPDGRLGRKLVELAREVAP